MYEQNSFDPVARVVQLSEVLEKQRIAEKILYIQQHVPSEVINQDFYHRIEQAKTPLIQIYHYHCNHLGTPQELSDEKGDIVWLSYDRAWGGSFDSIYKQQFIDNFAITESELQPIKFQGQSLDTETGLHYNRFRYYDSDVGMFISRDPIGLLGGDNVFAYAPNPTQWIDPYGLWKKHRKNGEWAKKPGPKPKKKQSTHGNSHDCCKKAYGYKLVDRDTGELLKYGETTEDNPINRYSQPYYESTNSRMVVMQTGTKKEMHEWQHLKILEYKAQNGGRRPPLNKSDY